MKGREVGCLGDIVFEVSSNRVETITSAQWSGSSRYAVHQRHLYHAATEFTGMDPDKFTFDMYLSTSLNVDVMKEMVKLWTYMRNGKALPLTIGDKGYGKYRWNITSINHKFQQYDCKGNVIGATVSVTLQEYINW